MDHRWGERFPGSEGVIRGLQEQNESFRGACADLEEASRVLDSLKGASEIEQSRISRYQALVAELEREIRSYLDDAGDPVPFRRGQGEDD